jgi:hypothetical protein
MPKARTARIARVLHASPHPHACSTLGRRHFRRARRPPPRSAPRTHRRSRMRPQHAWGPAARSDARSTLGRPHARPDGGTHARISRTLASLASLGRSDARTLGRSDACSRGLPPRLTAPSAVATEMRVIIASCRFARTPESSSWGSSPEHLGRVDLLDASPHPRIPAPSAPAGRSGRLARTLGRTPARFDAGPSAQTPAGTPARIGRTHSWTRAPARPHASAARTLGRAHRHARTHRPHAPSDARTGTPARIGRGREVRCVVTEPCAVARTFGASS